MQNFPKLLRTLIEHDANRLLLPEGEPPRAFFANRWQNIEDHPPIDLKEGLESLRQLFPSDSFNEFQNGIDAIIEYRENRFHLSLQEGNAGDLVLVEMLKPIPRPDQWPTAVHNWLSAGGYLEVHNPELYAGILKNWIEKNNAIAVSLEKRVLYPLDSKQGFITQKELGRDFSNLKEGLLDAFALKPKLLALNQLPLSEKEQSVIKELARRLPVLVHINPSFLSV